MVRRLVVFCFGAALASTAAAQPVVDSFTYNGETVYGIRELPGVALAGTYLFEGAEPRVELNADGTGCWANHSRACKRVEWWIHSDAAGNPTGAEGEGGALRTILFRHIEDPSDGSTDGFSGFQLTIDNAAKEIRIAEERVKPF